MYAQREPQEPSPGFKYLRHLGIGTEFFFTVALFTLAGVYGDRKLGTGVLLTLLGLAVGFSAGVYRLWREAFAGEKPRDGAERDAEGPGPPGEIQ